jgi:hypothetical protein
MAWSRYLNPISVYCIKKIRDPNKEKMDYFPSPFMNQEYLRFKLFPDKQAAEDFAEVLKQNDIEYQIEEDALEFDPG